MILSNMLDKNLFSIFDTVMYSIGLVAVGVYMLKYGLTFLLFCYAYIIADI